MPEHKTIDLIKKLSHADQKNELWIKRKYDQITNDKVSDYCLVAISLKNFLEYRHIIGHLESERCILSCYQLLYDCLSDDDCIVRVHSWYFNLLIKCPPEEDLLHAKAGAFHYAIRDGMEKKYGRRLFLEMGFYPMIKPDVDFYNAQYFADLCRFCSEKNYLETNYDFYYISYQNQKEDFLKIENLVECGLEHGDFKLYLQPKVDLVTGKVYRAEALMRWIDPERGMIPLTSFLPNLEDNGFIRNVDLHLFDKACGYLEKWKHDYQKDIQISFNLSRAYFKDTCFIADYSEVFKKHDISSDQICIELLESIILNDLERVKNVVEGIYGMGFDCALDDFGSGFSSFDVLTNITLNELKIDRALFLNINNQKEHSLIRHLVEIAHAYNMTTVAEGIETKDYADYLKKIGCDFIQGYYYYKPMPVEEFERIFISNEHPPLH